MSFPYFAGSIVHKMQVDRQYMGVSKRKCIIWGVAFLSDGTVISVDSAGKVQFWDSATGTLVKNHLVANADVQSIAVSDVSTPCTVPRAWREGQCGVPDRTPEGAEGMARPTGGGCSESLLQLCLLCLLQLGGR